MMCKARTLILLVLSLVVFCASGGNSSVLLEKGRALAASGKSAEAVECFEQARKAAASENDKAAEAEACNNLFTTLYAAGRLEEGEEALERAVELNTSLGNNAGLCRNYNNLAIVALDEKDFARAGRLFDKALRFAHSDSAFTSAIEVNIAEMHGKNRRPDLALEHQERALALVPDSDEVLRQRILLNKMSTLLDLRRFADARQIKLQIEKDLHKVPIRQRVDVLAQMADTEFVLGDSLSGLRYVLECVGLEDSLHIVDQKKQIADLSIAYDSARLREQAASLMRQRTILWGGILVALLVIVVVSLVAGRWRSDRRKNALIADQKSRLLELERTRHQLMQQQLKSDLDTKHRELTSYTMDLAAVSEYQTAMSRRLASLGELIETDSEEAIRLAAAISADFDRHRLHSASDDFRRAFDGVHPEFMLRLSERYPRLTETDLRVCAFLAMGMSTKEMAALMQKEVRSVESTRNRLRKKLDLPAGASLQDFLRTFL